MKFTKLFLLLVFQVLAMPVSAAEYSVGLFPTSFPRDPVDVNVFLEHILLGQILEPLVESGPDGMVAPAACSRWQFSEDGMVLRFFFDPNAKFSNGQRLSAEDAKYTLERHATSPNSQSKSYLKRIESMEVVSPTELALKFKTPYVAILKALSRDHLGIVPKGWKFDAQAAEPFTGSGAYRAVRESGGGWILVKNSNYRNAANVQIERWNVVFSPAKGKEASMPLPDLVPFAFGESVDQMRRHPQWQESRYVEEPVTHFFQSSAWWYPHGKTFEDAQRQKLGMCAIEDLISQRALELGIRRATGLIPEGIAGHLNEKPAVTCQPSDLKAIKNRNFKVAILTREMAMLNEPATLRKIQAKWAINLEIIPTEAPEMKKLVDIQPDIFILGFAGGFQDPEGFLTVITAMLNSDLERIFQSDYPTYLGASSEGDWQKRTPKYQTINRHLISNLRMAPLWRVKATRVRCHDLILGAASDLRYSPKLKDFGLRKEKP